MKCEEVFSSLYHFPPTGVTFCPYRICPVGAHIDHQLGLVTGMALDHGIHIAYHPKQNGVVELNSLQFNKRAQFHVNATQATKEGDWADYLRGATLALAARHRLSIGMAGVIEGTLPIGGLSSSAAVTISFLLALATVNELHLSPEEIIQIAQGAENNYVGVASGTLDQTCEVYCKKGHLLFLDTQDGTMELIPPNPKMKPYRIAIFFSGLDRSLVKSGFNMRVDECRAAAYSLLAYAGMEYGKFRDTAMRQVPREVFDLYGERLPEPFRHRAMHYFTEMERVQKAVNAWKEGDIEELGRLSFLSGHSSIDEWETGSPELKELCRIMEGTKGIYGGRFSGCGFRGCCMALIDPAYTESISEEVSEQYLKKFPELNGKYSIHICDSADGVLGQGGCIVG